MNIDLGKNIDTRELESKIQKFWEDNNFWDNDVNSSKKSFCIMMPPPNVTGNLHMGHALDNVLTDIICRYKRMDGFDVLWQPGTDHAAIATQLLVERDLSKRGINPYSLSLEEKLNAAWTWKADKGGQIMNQLHILGVTPVWKRERFTMDEGLSRAVTKLFVKMYNEGLIYRDKRLLNWCPKQQTTVSDLEIETREEHGKFYYFNYPLVDGGFVEIATTRLAQKCFDSNGNQFRNRILFDCNPPGKTHWSYRLFIEGVHPVSRLRINNANEYGGVQINPYDNADNLPKDYIEQTLGTASERSKKRFLYGEFSDENENALWKSSTMIDPYRVNDVPRELERIVVGVDPAVTSAESSDHTGIVICGSKTISGTEHYFVLQDNSLIAPPEKWAARVVESYDNWMAELVVAETNQGGDLVESVLRNIAPNLPIRKVRASRGKIVRAEPISTLYAQGRVHHVGFFEELENEMTSYTGDRSSEESPDRMDALVWALTELSTDAVFNASQGELFFE